MMPELETWQDAVQMHAIFFTLLLDGSPEIFAAKLSVGLTLICQCIICTVQRKGEVNCDVLDQVV